MNEHATTSQTPADGDGDGDVRAVPAHEDRRFTFGLMYDVAKVIEAHGYEGVLSGPAMVQLQGHLFAFLHGTDGGRDGRCYAKALAQVRQ